MTQEEIVTKWRESALDDLTVAVDLYTHSKRNAHSLYFCQLALEKFIKALIIKKTDEAPPITHDLIKLAHHANLALNELQMQHFREITTFNVEARYDIHKDRLYKKATNEYTEKYLQLTKEYSLWLQNQ